MPFPYDIRSTEGFDRYAVVDGLGGVSQRWTGDKPTWTLVPGRIDGQALRGANTNTLSILEAAVPNPTGEYFTIELSIMLEDLTKHYYGGLTANHNTAVVLFGDSSKPHLGLFFDITGRPFVCRMENNGGTQKYQTGKPLADSAGAGLSEDTWYTITIEGRIHDTLGEIRLYIDGATEPEIDLTGVDTRNGTATAHVNSIILSNFATGPNVFDDISLLNGASRLGKASRIQTLDVIGDSAVQFTPVGAASNYEALTGVVTPATYVEGDTIGTSDRLTLADITDNPQEIYGLIMYGWGMKSDATTREIKLQIESGASLAESSRLAMSASHEILPPFVVNANPDGGVQWTKAAVGAAEVGYEIAT